MNLILLAAERPQSIRSAIFLHGAARFGEADMEQLARAHPEWVEAWLALDRELASPEIPFDEKDERIKRFNLEVAFPAMLAEPGAGLEELQGAT